MDINKELREVNYFTFCKRICEDFNIPSENKIIKPYTKFPLVNDKRKINSSRHSTIVKDDKEYPYMLDINTRNEDRLIDFDYIYFMTPKSLDQIKKETGVQIKSKNCRICEGGGWYSQGTKYEYKDSYCEY